MKLRVVLAAALAAAGSWAFGDQLDVSQFAKTFTVVVPASSVPSGAVADFPALVRLSTAIDGFSYSDFRQQDGADLAFVDSEGNVLPHEIDTWNPGGESLVWVKVPLLSAGAAIRVYYGSLAYTSAVAATSVWSAYTGVWHMREASGTAYDSTANGLDAEPVGERTGDMIAYPNGAVGAARVNQTGDTGVHNRMAIPNYDSFALGDTFTFSGWFNISSQDGWNRIASRKASWGTAGMEVELNAGTAGMLDVYGNDGDSIAAAWPSSMDNGWAQLVFVYSGSTVKYYANGVFVAEKNDIAPIADNGQVLALGNNATGTERSFFGRYDEVRLSGATPTAGRIAADYATVHDKGFFVYGAVSSNTTVNPANYTRFVQLTIGSSAIANGTLLPGVPVLVRLSTAITGFDYNDFGLSRGGDLVFADADGNVLAHEVDVWDTSGESLVWVKVPLLASGSTIYAYWGSATASPVASSATWGAFKGVWHMNESGSTTEPDVSGNGLDAVPTSNSLTGWEGEAADTTGLMTTCPGVVGTARRNQDGYAGYVHNRLLVPSYTLGDTFTVSGWFYQKNIFSWHRILTRKEVAGDSGWHIEWDFGGTEGAGTGMVALGDGTKSFSFDVGSIKDKWTYLTFVYEGTSLKVCTNGALCAAGEINAAVDNGNPLAIGGSPNGSQPSFEGYYDEVRLGAGALSAERIAVDYEVIHDASFVAFGSVGVPVANAPVMDVPVIAKNAGGDLTVTVSMTSGTGTPYARFVSAAGNSDFALSEGVVTGPQSYTIAVPAELAADNTYSVDAVGVNTAGGEVVAHGAGRFYNGVLSVAKTSDAAEDGPVAGVFTVSRADAYGDLTVNYSLSGTAVAGTDYVGAASGTVVIPNGATSATVSIMPKVNVAESADTSVVFAFADGLYTASASTATMTIANLEPVDRKSFRRRVEFTFPMDFLGEGEVLTNFPALVRLSTAIPGFSYSDFQLANGGDMMFTDSLGQAIPSEVDTWDDAGTSLVWVSVPELTKGTTIKMYYGNGANPAGVPLAKWPGYAGVWHMGEASGTAHDSTENGLDAEPVHNNPWNGDQTAIADGAVGKGRINQMESTRYSVDYLTYDSDADVRASSKRSFARVADYSSLEVGSRFTFSGWFRTVHGAEWDELIACRNEAGNHWGWNVKRLPTANDEDVHVSVHVADGGGKFTIPNMKGSWVHLVFSFDKVKDGQNNDVGEVTVYGNGEAATLYDGSGRGSTFVHDVALPLTFGNQNDVADGLGYNGQYDELRLKRGTASASWAKAEYRTVTDATFVSASEAMPAVGGFILIVR